MRSLFKKVNNMIKAFIGDIRVGKTSLMVLTALSTALSPQKRAKRDAETNRLIKRGYAVKKENYGLYSNLSINYDDGRYIKFNSINIEPKKLYIGSDQYIRAHSTIAIEEVQRYFPCREFSKFTTAQSLYFQTSGHYGIDIYLDTQDITNVDKNVRNLCKICYVRRREIYNVRGALISTATPLNFGNIKFYVTEYDNLRQFEAGKSAAEKKIEYSINPFELYNSFSRDPEFYPADLKTPVL